MRNSVKALIVASALAAGVAVAPTVSAHEARYPQGPTMGHGGMMDHHAMMNMMGQMMQMSQMVETCNKMMQDALEKRDEAPEAPPRQQE